MSRSPNLNQLTLRDKIREAARRSHELNEHLEQAFVPKVHQLRKLTRPPEPGVEIVPISDTTIRTQVATILDAEKYSSTLDDDASALFAAIIEEIDQILTNGSKR